ncbi:MAG TPA: hypothetical protein VMR96_07860 [Solirubrobacterales bacterium]|nr:hypothetical protein [Solirubrobacterales bacterium]
MIAAFRTSGNQDSVFENLAAELARITELLALTDEVGKRHLDRLAKGS